VSTIHGNPIGKIKQRALQSILKDLNKVHNELGENLANIQGDITESREKFTRISQLIVLLKEHPKVISQIEAEE
jgi:endonuclease IV